MTTVIDASVAAKWLLPEPGSDEAIALQEDTDTLLAPDLIRLEVAAAITRRVRDMEKPIAPKDAEDRCARWFRLLDNATVELVPQDQILTDAIKLSIKCKHALQDCLYLAIAQRHNLPLITADRTFHKRVVTFYPKIALLPGCHAN